MRCINHRYNGVRMRSFQDLINAMMASSQGKRTGRQAGKRGSKDRRHKTLAEKAKEIDRRASTTAGKQKGGGLGRKLERCQVGFPQSSVTA